ncbi:MAG: sulfatase-like hydrolase/transferase [Phycisphaerales bacterium]|nr:MAG: sulfatase-like hydrolase/transferase [Phycisphaerales bacterium]
MRIRSSRREFLKSLGLGAAALAVPGCGGALSRGEAAGSDRPNIVLIMADDMGFSDIGCYGGEIETPNLDRLARDGLRFTQFYNTARCCPTRAALMTGLYSHQAGIGHMVGNHGHPAYQGYLNRHCVTIAEVLKSAGYQTLMTGKWHVGNRPGRWPHDRGFDRFYGSNTSTGSYFGIHDDSYDRRLILDDKEVEPPAGWYATDAYTDYAIDFVKTAGQTDQPFFLYTAYTAPHWPLHALPDDIAKYRGKYRQGWDVLRSQRRERMIELGLVERRWALPPRGGKPWESLAAEKRDEMDLRMAVYAAMVDRMDCNIGRLVKTLKEIGAFDNTLILFLSDNGGCAEGGLWGFNREGEPIGSPQSYASYGLCWANASDTPFKRYKKWTHEGGIATPLIAHWPRIIQRQGKLVHEPGHVIDIMATCCDVTGATYPRTYGGHAITPLEGKSLLPLLKGNDRKGHDAIFWEHEGNRAVRQGKWKLVAAHREPWELYDLEADRTELHNLAERFPEKVSELKSLYRSWAKRCGVQPWPLNKRIDNRIA